MSKIITIRNDHGEEYSISQTKLTGLSKSRVSMTHLLSVYLEGSTIDISFSSSITRDTIYNQLLKAWEKIV